MEFMAQISESLAELLPNPWVQASLWVLIAVVASHICLFTLNHINWLGASKTANKLDDLVIQRIRSPLRWSILFVGFYFAVKQLPIDQSWSVILLSIELTIAVVLWLSFVLKIVRYLLTASTQSSKGPTFIQPRTLPLFENLAIIVSFVTGAYFILVAWDISVGPVIASAGIAGLAISLAAKDTMANLFAGVFIMADGPYQLGDYIVLDGGERGKVTHIGIRSTRILTRGDVEVTIPNAIMGNSKIINETAGRHEKYRIQIPIGLAYGSNIRQIRRVLLNVAANNKDICPTPEARVRFRSFGDSALLFELLCWVPEPERRGAVVDILNEQVYDALNEHKIIIPFPQQDIYLHRVSAENNGE